MRHQRPPLDASCGYTHFRRYRREGLGAKPKVDRDEVNRIGPSTVQRNVRATIAPTLIAVWTVCKPDRSGRLCTQCGARARSTAFWSRSRSFARFPWRVSLAVSHTPPLKYLASVAAHSHRDHIAVAMQIEVNARPGKAEHLARKAGGADRVVLPATRFRVKLAEKTAP